MNYNELFEMATEHQRQINETMKRIEGINNRLEVINDTSEVCIVTGTVTSRLDDILSRETIRQHTSDIIAELRKECGVYESRLRKLIDPRCEVITSDQVKKNTITEAELNDLLAKGMKPDEIAKQYGRDKSGIYKLMQKYGIKAPTKCKGPVAPEIDDTVPVPDEKPLDGNRIKDMYVNKRMALGDIAAEMGTTKKIIYDFIEQMRIYRPTQEEYEFQQRKTGKAKVSAR